MILRISEKLILQLYNKAVLMMCLGFGECYLISVGCLSFHYAPFVQQEYLLTGMLRSDHEICIFPMCALAYITIVFKFI